MNRLYEWVEQPDTTGPQRPLPMGIPSGIHPGVAWVRMRMRKRLPYFADTSTSIAFRLVPMGGDE